ncbi:epoxide hydrolase family protein, partial [Bradyrhizobium genomosp. III]
MTAQARTESLNPDRRQLLSQAAMTAVAASVSSLLPLHPARAAAGGAIRPFQMKVPEQDLLDLRRRLAATRWPDREIVNDQSQGVQLTTVQQLVRYWQSDYDWRKLEARLNALPQFVTEIDGVDIHFIHVRSRHENALPMIVTHGWPGSIIEQMKIVGPLTDPTAHGAKAADAFDLVIPSLPGHGFSGKPAVLGWDPQRIAR